MLEHFAITNLSSYILSKYLFDYLLQFIKASPIASSDQDNDTTEQVKEASVLEDAPWYKFCVDNIRYYQNKANENNARRKRETYNESTSIIMK